MVENGIRHRMSLCVSKEGDARFMGQLDFSRLLERSLRRSGLPVEYTQGFNPRIRLSFSDALPLGVASSGEWVSLILTEALHPDSIRAKLDPALPESVSVVDVCRGLPPEPTSPVRYRLDVTTGLEAAADALTALLACDEHLVEDPRRKQPVNARAFLHSGSVQEDHLVVGLVTVNGRPPRPGHLIRALADLARDAGAEPPVFGTCTKLAVVERRQGAEAWHDAVGTKDTSCSSTRASPKRAASPSSRMADSTSTT